MQVAPKWCEKLEFELGTKYFKSLNKKRRNAQFEDEIF